MSVTKIGFNQVERRSMSVFNLDLKKMSRSRTLSLTIEVKNPEKIIITPCYWQVLG